MNHFVLSLIAVTLVVIAWGWITEQQMLRRGPVESQRLDVYKELVSAVLFKLLVLLVNYRLASTALSRILSREKMTGDPILNAFFDGSGLRVNHLTAVVAIGASFLTIGRMIDTFQACSAALHPSQGARRIGAAVRSGAAFAFWMLLTGMCLYFDTSLLMLRTATLIWSTEYSGQIQNIPNLTTIIAQHPNMLSTWLIKTLAAVYPVFILLSVLGYVKAWLRLKRFVRAMAQERAAVAAGGNPLLAGAPAQPATPAPAGPGAVGMPVPGVPAQMGVPAAPGAPHLAPANWIRPIPVNPGPGANGNVHHAP